MTCARSVRPTSEPIDAVGPPRRLNLRGAGGIGLVADAWGDPEAAPVLLLHGGGQTRHAWGGTAEALAAHGFHAVSMDLRGHGESEWSPDGSYDYELFAEDVRVVAAGFPRAPALVGASLGGIASLIAQGEAPEPIASALVLVDIAPRLEPEGVTRIVEFMRARPDGFESLQEAADTIAAYLPHRPRPNDLSGLRKNLRKGPDGRYRWHWDPRFMDPDRRLSASRSPERLVAAARNLRVPTLLVRGRRSDILSEEGAREFLEDAPDARYVDVSGAGHMVAGDRNDAFTSAVVDFLEEALHGA